MVVKELLVKLGIKSNEKDFKKAENGMERLVGFAQKAAVAFASFKLGQWIKGIASDVATLGDKFDKMAARTGVSAQRLQELGYSAELTGSNIETVEVAIRTMQRTIDEAAAGVATYKDEYDRLGVNVKDTSGKIRTFEELLPDVIAGIAKLTTDTEKSAVALKILGRGGTQLLPLFKSGPESINAMAEEFRALGTVIDKDLQKQSADYIDNQTRMRSATLGIKNVIAKQLLPVFNDLAKEFLDWFKLNREWLALRVGVVFEKLGRLIKNISTFLGDVISKVIEWGKKLSSFETMLLKLTGLIAGIAVVLALPAGSILLLIGLIALIIDDIQEWRKGNDSLFGDLVDWLKKIFGFDLVRFFLGWASALKTTITKMSETLAGFVLFFSGILSGDFTKAWNTFNQGMTATWGNTFGDLREIFEFFETSFVNWMLSIGRSIWGGIGKFFKDLWKDLKISLDFIKRKIIEWSNALINRITAPFRKVKEFVSDIFGGEDEVEIGVKEPILAKTIDPEISRLIRITQEPVLQKTIPQKFNQAKSINTPTNKIDVTVNASPGMDENRLSSMVVEKVRSELDRSNQLTLDGLLPARP